MTAIQVTRWNGEAISKPGIYSGVPLQGVYHTQSACIGPSISSSGARTIFYESPAHYFAGSDLNPKAEPRKTTEAMLFGAASHHLLLGEADFQRFYAVRPEELADSKTGEVKPWQGNRTDCKAWVKHMTEGEGRQVLKLEEVDKIRGIAGSLAGEPLIQAGILNGLIEHSIVWQDKETGIWLKVRPDAIPTDSADFSDLKCTVSVRRDRLIRTVADYGYHMQGAMVAMACREVLGKEIASFSLVFVEKDPPHSVRVVTLKQCDLELGEKQVRAALHVFKRCLETGTWPGPGGVQTDAEYIELDDFARKRIEDRLPYFTAEYGVAA